MAVKQLKRCVKPQMTSYPFTKPLEGCAFLPIHPFIHNIGCLIAGDQTLHVDYTMGPAIAQNPYHIPIVRQQLTRNLAALFPSVREELAQAFSDNIPIDGDGTERLSFIL